MPVLGTTVSDPYFYHNRMQQTGQALGAFVDAFHQRRQEKEQREQEEINQAFKAIQTMPELADTWGADLERKYGKKYPEIPQILSVVRQRQQLAKELPSAGQAWENTWEGLQKEYADKQKRLAETPPMVPAPAPLGITQFDPFAPVQPPPMIARPQTIPVPNPERAALEKQVAGVRPELFPKQALEQLSPRQQMLARAYAKSRDYEIPEQTPWDPFGQRGLSEKARGAHALDRGYIDPGSEAAEIIRAEGGSKLSKEDEAKQGFTREERLGREKHDTEQEKLEDKLMRERATLEHGYRMAQQNRQISGEKEVISYREGFEDKGGEGGGEGSKAVKDRADVIVTDSKEAVADWDRRRSDALANIPSGKGKRDEALRRFIRENGPRPTPIPRTIARQMARKIAEEGLAGSEADEAAISLSASFAQEVKKGGGSQVAFDRATKTATPPSPHGKGPQKRPARGGAAAPESTPSVAPAAPAPRLLSNRGDRQKTEAPAQPPPENPQLLFGEVKDPAARDWSVAEYLARVQNGQSPDEAKAAIMDYLRAEKQLR